MACYYVTLKVKVMGFNCNVSLCLIYRIIICTDYGENRSNIGGSLVHHKGQLCSIPEAFLKDPYLK